MTIAATGSPTRTARDPHVLGDVGRGLDGPTAVLTGGLHGNEPAGVHAVRNVLETLHRENLPLRGRVVGIAGNLKALDADVRFLGRDLNRRWFPEALKRLQELSPEAAGPEDVEQRELVETYSRIIGEAPGPVAFLDLHTTSSDSAPFSAFADSLENIRLARRIPVTTIIGLAEVLDGPMLSYFTDHGHPCVVVEGGQHTSPAAVGILESAAWLFLEGAGCIATETVPDLAGHRARLRAASAGQPDVVEIRYRHGITPDDDFRMEPGFRTFQAVTEGQLLARDRTGDLVARQDGRLLMPLYQGQGEDGFFLARDVGPLHLTALATLRRAGADRLLHWLPGVRRHPRHADRFEVDMTRAGRWTTGALHLLGYRRVRPEGEKFVFSKRAAVPE